MKYPNSTVGTPATRSGFFRVLMVTALMAGLSGARATEPSIPYTVKAGDKLIVLSRDLLLRPGDWNEVARFNAMPDPNVIRPGQTLAIPVRLMKFSPATGKLVSAEGQVLSGAAPAVVGSSIGEGSRLQTGPNSSAVVELADGSRVQLLAGSLAEIAVSREYASRDANSSAPTSWFSGLIRLSQGAVETLASKLGRRATPLQVETPTTIVGVRGTRFRVAYGDSAARDSRAEVLEGEVRADNPAHKSGADLPKGTGAVIDPAQKDVQVVPLLPAPDLGSRPSNLTRPQATAWPMPALAGASAFRVQVASDARFERIVRDLKVSTAAVDLSGLPAGLWHVRVRGIDALQLEGYDSVIPLSLKEAHRWRVTDSRLVLENGRARLAWSGALPDGLAVAADSASAEVSTDALSAHVISRPTGSANQLDLGDLKPGRYFIRITTAGAGGQLVSETYQLDVPGNWGVTVLELASALQPVGP